MTQFATYFSPEEFACSHCGSMGIKETFVKQLDALRNSFGNPLTITSGYRCAEHPIEKAKKNGPGSHSTGFAADILISRKNAYELMGLVLDGYWKAPIARKWHFTGIGINQKGSDRFIHLDSLSEKEGFRPTIWSY